MKRGFTVVQIGFADNTLNVLSSAFSCYTRLSLLFGTKKLRKKCRAMVRSENLGLGKTHITNAWGFTD